MYGVAGANCPICTESDAYFYNIDDPNRQLSAKWWSVCYNKRPIRQIPETHRRSAALSSWPRDSPPFRCAFVMAQRLTAVPLRFRHGPTPTTTIDDMLARLLTTNTTTLIDIVHVETRRNQSGSPSNPSWISRDLLQVGRSRFEVPRRIVSCLVWSSIHRTSPSRTLVYRPPTHPIRYYTASGYIDPIRYAPLSHSPYIGNFQGLQHGAVTRYAIHDLGYWPYLIYPNSESRQNIL